MSSAGCGQSRSRAGQVAQSWMCGVSVGTDLDRIIYYSFFTPEGLELAVNGSLERMEVATLPKPATQPKTQATPPAFGKAPVLSQ